MRKSRGGRPLLIPFLILLGFSMSLGISLAQEAEGTRVESKEVTGTVSAVSKQGIAVEYSQTSAGSYEMFLPFASQVTLQRMASVDQLKVGDTVKVRYQKTIKENPKGQPVVLKTLATEISLIQRAPESPALASKEQE